MVLSAGRAEANPFPNTEVFGVEDMEGVEEGVDDGVADTNGETFAGSGVLLGR